MMRARLDCRLDASQPRLEDKDTHYALSVSAPGVAAQDLKIEAMDDRVSIKGETATTTHTHFLNYTVAIPADADADSASATSADGLLVVTLPKKAVAAPMRLVVSADAEASDEEPDSSSDAERPYKLTMVATGIAAADLDVSFEAHGVLKVAGESKRTGAEVEPKRIVISTGGVGSEPSGEDTIKMEADAVAAPSAEATDAEAEDAVMV